MGFIRFGWKNWGNVMMHVSQNFAARALVALTAFVYRGRLTASSARGKM
jgi:hypothetical protein